MGTRSNRIAEAVLTSTHNLCFEQKYEKYQKFLSENFHFFFFLVVKFSAYLNRYVFVMGTKAAFRRESYSRFALDSCPCWRSSLGTGIQDRAFAITLHF